MTDSSKLSAYWDFLLHGRGTMHVSHYLKMIEIFVNTGEIAGRGVAWPEDQLWREYDDPLVVYLIRLMSDPQIKAQVLGSRMCGKIFYSTVGRFVVAAKHQEEFFTQRQWTERNNAEKALDWSIDQRTEAWRKLLQEIDGSHSDDGFDTGFYQSSFASHGVTDDTTWAKMIADWVQAINSKREKGVNDYVEKHGEAQRKVMGGLMRNAQQAIKKAGTDDDKAVQAWQNMNGRWDEPEFIKQMSIVNIQKRYPQLEQIVRLMGRVPNSSGSDHMAVSTERKTAMQHSAGSDIDGITTGRDLTSLLPIEMAQFTDADTEDAFLHRYVRGRLQTFRYQSNMASQSRRLSHEHAARKGPMIVCVDTSASMYGVPQRIIKCLLGMIEDTAEKQQRDCFLIDFSVSVLAVDLMQRRKQRQYEALGLRPQEYAFEKGHVPFIGGGTDAGNMMEATFRLLNGENGKYVNADVLWVSDFLIDKPGDSLMHTMKSFRETGTRFYGLRIVPKGEERSGWEPYFDKISDVEYQITRKY